MIFVFVLLEYQLFWRNRYSSKSEYAYGNKILLYYRYIQKCENL